MPAVMVKFEGDKKMRDNILNVAKNFPKETRKGTRDYAKETAVPRAQENSPVKTGKLRDSTHFSISIRKSPGKENVTLIIAMGGKKYGVLYAAKAHQTSKTHPLFLLRTIQDLSGSAMAEIGTKIDLRRAMNNGTPDTPVDAE